MKKSAKIILICAVAVSLLLAAFSLATSRYKQPKTLFDLGIADIAYNDIVSIGVVLDGGERVVITDTGVIDDLQTSLQGMILIRCRKKYKVPGVRAEITFMSAEGRETSCSVLNNTFEYNGKLYKTNINLNRFVQMANAG